MPLQVIGAGVGRTGTTSLRAALEILLKPGSCYDFGTIMQEQHMHLWQRALEAGVSPDWAHVFDDKGVVATMDHPCAEFWEELAERYPGAKVILSEHPGGPEKWYESKMAHRLVGSATQSWPIKPLVRYVYPIISRLIFRKSHQYSFDEVNRFAHLVEFQAFGSKDVHDKAHALRCYQQRIDSVKAKIPSERLLVFNVKMGWKPLCEFLGCPEPEETFPKEDSHSTEKIRRFIWRTQMVLWLLYASGLAGSLVLGSRLHRCLRR